MDFSVFSCHIHRMNRQFSSITQLCLTLCDPMDCSMPGFPVLGIYSNSCPLSCWCHPIISPSVLPFSSRLQSLPASGSFQMSQYFTSGVHSIGVSASAPVLPMNTQDWFPLGWTGWLSLLSKGWTFKSVLQHHSSKESILWCSAFFTGKSHIHTWLLEKPKLWLNGPLLAK